MTLCDASYLTPWEDAGKTTHQRSGVGAKALPTCSAVAHKILSDVMLHRRTIAEQTDCNPNDCSNCRQEHVKKIELAVRTNQPVPFVLPAFPGKSPNHQKVLGVLPDYAEYLAFEFLGKISKKIKKYYAPGIQIILCSDGRVFSDIVGIKETDVSLYQIELGKLIREMSLSEFSIVNLEDFFGEMSFAQMRDELMKRHGSSLEVLKHRIRLGENSATLSKEKQENQLYCGITKFLFEDSIFPGQTKSKTALQKEARQKAYEVIRRSNAWSALIADRFPLAVRLSIHPQPCGSSKLGIQLVGTESWMTPWHGVAVQTSSGFILLKRSQAESYGAKLVYARDGRPSHYTLLTKPDQSSGDIQK